MFDNEPQINFDSVQPASPSTRRLQLLLALTLLITSLVLVLLKNRQFWSDLIGLEGAWDQTTSSPTKTIKKGEQRLNLPLSRKPRTEQSASSNAHAQTSVMAEPNETVLSPLRLMLHIPAANTRPCWLVIPPSTSIPNRTHSRPPLCQRVQLGLVQARVPAAFRFASQARLLKYSDVLRSPSILYWRNKQCARIGSPPGPDQRRWDR